MGGQLKLITEDETREAEQNTKHEQQETIKIEKKISQKQT